MIIRRARSLSSDVALMARGAILWDDDEDGAEEEDIGPRPWWARKAEVAYSEPALSDTKQAWIYLRDLGVLAAVGVTSIGTCDVESARLHALGRLDALREHADELLDGQARAVAAALLALP